MLHLPPRMPILSLLRILSGGFLPFLSERERDIVRCRTNLIQVEDFRIPVRGFFEVGTGIRNVVDEGDLESGVGGSGE